MNSKTTIEQRGEHGRFSDDGSYLKHVPKFLSRDDESEEDFDKSAPDSNVKKGASVKPTIEEPGEHGRFSDAGSYFKHVPKFLSRDSAPGPLSQSMLADGVSVKSPQQQNAGKGKSTNETRHTSNPEQLRDAAGPLLQTFRGALKIDTLHHANSSFEYDEQANDFASLSQDEKLAAAVAVSEPQNKTGKQQHRIWILISNFTSTSTSSNLINRHTGG